LSKDYCGILLAAGAARRFGSNKLLHPLDGGLPLALAALANLRSAVPRVIAVVRPRQTLLVQRLSEAGATVIECANAEDGMGASLACGVKSAGEAAGWIVALADMPYIRPDSIAKVAAALAAGAAIAAPAYQGRRGHPVGLDYAYRRQLEALRGDVGARALIEQNPDSVTLIDVDDPGVCRDIDTPDDLRPNYG
jgi:molybdenum cofactor cytidylyltransferase